MRWAALPRQLASATTIGGIAAMLLALSTPLRASAATATLDCESGVLDEGEAGWNVLVFRLCPDRLTIGYENSESWRKSPAWPAAMFAFGSAPATPGAIVSRLRTAIRSTSCGSRWRA